MLETNPLTPRINNIQNGASWKVGDVKHSFLTEAQFIAEHDATWVLCDGQAVPGSDWVTITGNANVPDPRGRFLRAKDNGAGVNPNELAPGAAQGQATARNGLGITQNTTGSHFHNYDKNNPMVFAGGANPGALSATTSTQTNSAGNHNHAVAITGGDAETRPVNSTVNMFIKINRSE